VVRDGHGGLAVLPTDSLGAQSNNVAQEGRPGGLLEAVAAVGRGLDAVQPVLLVGSFFREDKSEGIRRNQKKIKHATK
jgi:hypothetical protein